MNSGVSEGYVSVVSEKNFEFESPDAAKLFIAICQGIDQYRDQGYRFSYTPKKTKKGFTIRVTDIGE